MALDTKNTGFLDFYRCEALNANIGDPARRSAWLEQEKARRLILRLVAEFRALGSEGRFVAEGLLESTGIRQAIPAELWDEASLEFATSRATSDVFAYRHVTIQRAAAMVDAITSQLIAWLERQRDHRGEQMKKELLELARAEFEGDLTAAIFNKGYKAVYARRRGRPIKK